MSNKAELPLEPVGIITKLDAGGRLSLPRAIKKRLGVGHGSEFEVMISRDGSSIIYKLVSA